MNKLQILTSLDAADPLPGLGRKVIARVPPVPAKTNLLAERDGGCVWEIAGGSLLHSRAVAQEFVCEGTATGRFSSKPPSVEVEQELYPGDLVRIISYDACPCPGIGMLPFGSIHEVAWVEGGRSNLVGGTNKFGRTSLDRPRPNART